VTVRTIPCSLTGPDACIIDDHRTRIGHIIRFKPTKTVGFAEILRATVKLTTSTPIRIFRMACAGL
tara:strand:+ start:573 stop:770 length:198 start_codon:yes stop_codon:yes gene_type:complete